MSKTYARFTRLLITYIAMELVMASPTPLLDTPTYVSDWMNMGKMCNSTTFRQKIYVRDDDCPDNANIQFDNLRCMGICTNVFEPNLEKDYGVVTNKCFMCKPDVTEVNTFLQCRHKKVYQRLEVVTGCSCTAVDCECPLRETD